MPIDLVTGGTGFIGLYVVKLLLERGHGVHTTVRSLKNPAKIKPLTDLQAKYPNQLTLFEADLMKDGTFKAAMKNCSVVYHIASPFLVPQQIKDGLKDCVEPALQGTKNVLQSVNETESVKRVVLTSSIAAIYGDSADVLKMKYSTLTEDYWNETSTISGSPYSYSKMIAEREAWKMQEAQARWDLVTINPGLVLGPSLSPESASGSLFMLENMYKGSDKAGVAELHYPIADVREVAKAHVVAGENPVAKGRYIVASNTSVSLLDMANYVRPIHKQPNLLPKKNLPKMMIYVAGPFMGLSWKWVGANIGIGYKVDNGKSVRDLGLVYPSNEEVVRSHYRTWEATNGAKK
ncbi:cinnamoyl-CoA reductase [Leptodontidium sp. 2 PMI_412]|nr:cinnamoyl-CoA reductase [Leptodontidium sp. 2 PMI_412]